MNGATHAAIELRRPNGESTTAPAPKKVLEAVSPIKPSLVTPVQVTGETFRDFLDALSRVADERASLPILRNARLTYTEGELMLEATNVRTWVIAKTKAIGGSDGFECVVPLKRARNVVRRILGSCSTIVLRIDAESLHFGNYSFPHGGSIRDYPQRPRLMAEELKVVLPAHYIDDILARVAAVASSDEIRMNLGGVHLDFNEGVAVATDGHRLHLLRLGELRIDAAASRRARPALTLSREFLAFLQAVVDREWVGLKVAENQVTAGGADYGVMTRPIEEAFPPWRKVVPSYEGYWVLDRKALLGALRDLEALKPAQAKLSLDDISEKLTVTARTPDGETYQQSMTAHRKGGPPAVSIGINPAYLRDAVDATEGGLVRLGFAEADIADGAVTVRGKGEDFLAVVMPCRLT